MTKPRTRRASAPDKAYWRSLERWRTAAPEPAPAVDEFPEGASETPDGISRRKMLGLMGATVALGGAVGCRRPVETIVPYVNAPEGRIPGIAEFYATTFKQGGHAFGALVESHGGRPTKLEGNPLHPSSGGAANAWMLASTLHLYDPDRSQHPHRHGAEDGDPEEATWDDFAAYWAQNRGDGAADGADLAVLAGLDPSPTRDRLAEAFRQRYPAARWVVWEPIHEGRVVAGIEAATGQALRPVHHLDEAEVIVTLGADPLLTGGDALRHGRGFAAGRRRGVDGGTMNRLYSVESTLTVTGAAADHRIPLRFDQLPALASALAAALGAGGGGGGDLPAAVAAQLDAIVADLRAAGSAALVIAAPELPPEVHGAVLAIHSALGAIGRTVTLHPAGPDDAVTEEALAGLVTAMADGSVNTLVTLGVNPVFDAPADLAFGEAMAAVPNTIHLGLYRDETGERATWHLPEAHFLEAWSDARAADGTLSIVQPLIAPLWHGRGAIEVLAMLAGEAETAGYELVRKTWGDTPFGIDEKTWRRTLHDGVAEGSAASAVAVAANAPAGGSSTAASGDLELTFHPASDLWDGRYANLGWLQELPDPITKITWDNAALFAPATAEGLGVSTGDRVRLTYRKRSVEAPAWVLPGQAEGSVALALGYGRRHAGRVGTAVGVDAFALRTSEAPGGGSGLAVEVLGGDYLLAQTQEHWSLEGRPLVREGTLDQFRAEPAFAQAPEAKLHLGSLWEEPVYDIGPQWGMAIDLNACIGCNACVVACQSENNIPVVGKEQVALGREMHWLRIDRYFNGDPAAPEVVFQPVSCQHCENAPCEQVCPVAATVHDREGINAMVYNRCIGTRYCSNNCPYKVRRFNFFNYTKDTPELMKVAMNPDVTVRSRGVMEKCTYCIQRINQAKIAAKRASRALADGDVRSACQQACPADCITFGDITDETSRVVVAKSEPRNYVMLAELNNKPRTSYLAKLRNPNPAWSKEAAG